MKKLKWLAAAVLMAAGMAFVSGCEDDDVTVHKITLHNKSSYTITQRISGYGNITIEAGKKRAFNDESFTLYEYAPKSKVLRIKENSHTFVYQNR